MPHNNAFPAQETGDTLPRLSALRIEIIQTRDGVVDRAVRRVDDTVYPRSPEMYAQPAVPETNISASDIVETPTGLSAQIGYTPSVAPKVVNAEATDLARLAVERALDGLQQVLPEEE